MPFVAHGAHESIANSLIFWSGNHDQGRYHNQTNQPSQSEIEACSETVASLVNQLEDEIHPVSKGLDEEKRISPYVDLFESMPTRVPATVKDGADAIPQRWSRQSLNTKFTFYLSARSTRYRN